MKNYEFLIDDVLQKMMPSAQNGSVPGIKKKRSRTRKNEYSINLKVYLDGILAVDVTCVDGLKEISVLEIMSVYWHRYCKWTQQWSNSISRSSVFKFLFRSRC